MPRQQAYTKKVNVTFSIPNDVNILLHTLVKRRSMSQFVSSAIQKALDEEKESLKAAYIAANSDTARNEVISDWDALDKQRYCIWK